MRRLDDLDVGRARVPREPYLKRWYAPRAAAELFAFRDLTAEYVHADVLRVVLSRAARSARRAAHFDLEAPREPQTGEYWCHKHKRSAGPSRPRSASSAATRSTRSRRIEKFAQVRDDERNATVLHGDACEAEYVTRFDGVLTSPPYPGLIDYHEQHRYAYELLSLDDRRELELGAAEVGTSRASIAAYSEGIARALANAASALAPGAPVSSSSTIAGISTRRSSLPRASASRRAYAGT